jgi:hypothetical protein
LTLKALLKERPVIYEIVPPRRDTSRYQTELRGVEEVLDDSRIAAINVPELINRRGAQGKAVYSRATIPPEEYALMIKEYKESIVNIVAPRLEREEFLDRARRILYDYRIPNVVLVGKERHQDVLPGPGVVEAFRLLTGMKGPHVALGGICIFGRQSQATADYGGGNSKLPEHRRVWLKAKAGCDFVTSQITFDSRPALDFLSSYQDLCERSGKEPLTVFVSLATVPTPTIQSLLESLDVVIPPRVQTRLLHSGDMASESVKIATEVFREIISEAEQRGIKVPLGLQIEQVGVHGDRLSLQLLDNVFPILGP